MRPGGFINWVMEDAETVEAEAAFDEDSGAALNEVCDNEVQQGHAASHRPPRSL